MSLHHSFLTSCYHFSKADGEIILPLLFDVILCTCEELTHSHFWTVMGSKAIKHERPKRAALWESSNPPMALLHSFLACNHLSPLSHLSTYRVSSGERPHRSQGENGVRRCQKVRELFQIDTRVMEHKFVFLWSVFKVCSAILNSEHLSLKDRQTPTTAFYFLTDPWYNKLPSCLFPSALLLCLGPLSIITDWNSSGSIPECNTQSPQQTQH